MSEPVLIRPGGGEVVADAPERRVEILSDHDSMHATLSRFGPDRDGADLHVHYEHTDLFYVLEGELVVRLGMEDEPVPVPAGTLARVPPLVVHGFRSGGPGVRYLNFHAPGREFADYMRAMRDGRPFSYDQHPPPEDGGRPVSESAIGGAELVAERPELRVALLADVEEFGIAEVASEPGGPPPPAHVHRRHAESFYVLEGELVFTVAGRELRAEAGTWAQVPPGVPHTFAAVGASLARFLDIHTPSCGLGEFVRALHQAETDEKFADVRAGFDQTARLISADPDHARARSPRGFTSRSSDRLSRGQEEVDRNWDALLADGGRPIMCGWLVDRFGVSWQIVPRTLGELLGDEDPERAGCVMEAMLGMEKIGVEGLRRAYEGAASAA